MYGRLNSNVNRRSRCYSNGEALRASQQRYIKAAKQVGMNRINKELLAMPLALHIANIMAALLVL
jgi:hypothetical protein